VDITTTKQQTYENSVKYLLFIFKTMEFDLIVQ